MQSPRLAARYAKSLLGLAIETKELETVYKDMLYLQSVCKSNREFALLLKSPIINAEKKAAILTAVTKGKVSELTLTFNRLLVKKGREINLPQIISAFIEQYNQYKEIYIIKLTTAAPISEALKKEIVGKIKTDTGMKNIDLKVEVNENLVGGFVLEMGNSLVDASISYDLRTIRKQFLNNDFIYKIR
jgi:F-type H+-transporting ATPase subunit delta